jgi:hypothetical protein
MLCYLPAMRKTSLSGSRSFCASIGYCLLAASFATMAVFAQEPSTELAVQMSKDPKQLMLLAARTNGLSRQGVKPWHLKASFSLYDSDGNASDQGTLEISWVNDHQYKIAWTGATFSRTYYGTKKGILVFGRANLVPASLGWAANEFVWPTLPPETLKELKFERRDEDAGGTELACLTLKDPKGVTRGGFQIPTYCLDSNLPILRIGTHEGDSHRFLRNNIFSFQNRYVPTDIVAVIANRTDLRVHLEDLEVLKTINDADFEPPPDVHPVISGVTLTQ